MRIISIVYCLRNRAFCAALFAVCLLCIGCNASRSAGGGYVLPTGFTSTGGMGLQRFQHTATLLKTGDVLIDGGGWTTGFDPHKLTQSGQPAPVDVPASGCALYVASQDSFTPCLNPDPPRYEHTATALQDGTVLIAGGEYLAPTEWPPQGSLQAQAEVFDPTLNEFSYFTGLNTPRRAHTATLLNSGDVLIAGGATNDLPIASAELYSASTRAFTYTDNLNIARYYATATLLRNGLVLITGGVGAGNSCLASAELYDPSSGTFALTGSMSVARAYHTATLLSNGSVLVAGGLNGTNVPLSSAEIYNPTAGNFTPTSNMNVARANHTATSLPNGIVLIAGGQDSSQNALSSAELYSPMTGIFTPLSGALNTARYGHVATLLGSGSVLLTGGIGPDPVAPSTAVIATSSAELY
jgi:hypothetical protein